MPPEFKQSRFNHFIDLGDGKRLAFNASVSGLAEMDDETYRKMIALCEGRTPKAAGVSEELLHDLKRGKYIIDSDIDELDIIRAAHYSTRFGTRDLLLTIIPTYACNFACDYCYEPSEMHGDTSGATMSEETGDALVSFCRNNLQEKTNLRIFWYGGEPLMAKSTITELTGRFVEICKEKSANYHGAIVTNGYLLTPDTIDFLKKQHVTFIQVTIDGPREIHDRRRPNKSKKGTYDVITSNIDDIADDEPVHVSIRINIDKRNAGHIGELFGDLKRRGWHERKNMEFYFGHTTDYSQRWGSGLRCMMSEEFSEFIVDAYNMVLDHGFRISLFPNAKPLFCGAIGNSSMVIEPNGNIQACWAAVGNPALKIGTLGTDGVTNTKERIKWLGWDPFREECKKCTILPLCVGGCPYRSIYADSLAGIHEKNCTWWKYNLEPMLRIAFAAHKRGLLAVHRKQKSAKKEQSPRSE